MLRLREIQVENIVIQSIAWLLIIFLILMDQ